MKCPVCIEENQKSTVRDRGSARTLLACSPFYDEEGRSHHHDGNTTTTGYSCSRGHYFAVKSTGSCWCGWNKDQTPRVSVQTLPPRGSIEVRGSERILTDSEVLKAMFAAPSEFSILRHGCGD